MDFNEFLNLLWQKKRAVLSIALAFLAAATIFVLVTPLKYETTSRLVILQDFREGESTYNITQSNIHLSGLLSRVVDSSSFFKEVMNSGYNINESYFSPVGDDAEMMSEWRETVEARAVNGEGGVVEVTVYHADKVQLRQIAEAVNHVMEAEHESYHGLDERVEVKVIDSPAVSEFPTKPNVFLILSLALILGLTTGASYVFLISPSRGRDKVGEPRASGPRSYPEYPEAPSRQREEPRKSAEKQPAEGIPIIQEDQEKYLNPTSFEEEEAEDDLFEEKFPERTRSREEMKPEDIERRGNINNILGN